MDHLKSPPNIQYKFIERQKTKLYILLTKKNSWHFISLAIHT